MRVGAETSWPVFALQTLRFDVRQALWSVVLQLDVSVWRETLCSALSFGFPGDLAAN
jgi:hypothetical protein